MEIPLNALPSEPVMLPSGYHWKEWDEALVERHAVVKYRSFKDELDSEVFACLGDYYGCLRLMNDISRQETFLAPATWLIFQDDEREPIQDCGTIQGIALTGQLGSIQNVGVVPEHRGMGLGRAIVLKSLEGFRRAGLSRVVLEVTANNEAAVELYRSLGFVTVRTMYRISSIEEPIV